MRLGRRGLLALGAALGAVALGAGAGQLAGCDDEARPASDRAPVLETIVDGVVLPQLDLLHQQVTQLRTALDAFTAQPTVDTLTAARQAWSAARGAYRRTMAFAVGPGDDIAVTGGILDEPSDGAKLEELAARQPPVDLTAVRSAPAQTRGFLAIEYLLFVPGQGDEQVASGFAGAAGEGRRALLSALGTDLGSKLDALVDAWAPGKGDFGAQVRTAGRGSSAYKAQRDAFDALLNQSLAIAERMLDITRLSAGVPSTTTTAPLADRSDRTRQDLQDDLAGIESLYTSKVGAAAAGPSISGVVAEGNAPADATMRAALTDAGAALAAFAGPLRGSAATQAAAVDDLILKLRAVRQALSAGVFTALGVSVGISDKDGD